MYDGGDCSRHRDEELIATMAGVWETPSRDREKFILSWLCREVRGLIDASYQAGDEAGYQRGYEYGISLSDRQKKKEQSLENKIKRSKECKPQT